MKSWVSATGFRRRTTRLTRQRKAIKPEHKDYVLSDVDWLQLRVRLNRSVQWNIEAYWLSSLDRPRAIDI